MNRSKKIFVGAAVIFFALLFYASWDISTKTTFPGSRPQLKERIQKQYQSDTIPATQNDSSQVDSLVSKE